MATLEAPVRPTTSTLRGHFVNEPSTDFTRSDVARQMRSALDRVRGQLGREYDLIIGGRRIRTTDKIRSLNPARPSEVVGIHQKAGKEHVEPAMKAALAAFESWSRTPLEKRVDLLFRTADLLRERKFELMAWLVYEVSKNWGEADADIAETIDFCELYAREALRLSHVKAPVQLPGERDHLFYIPLGVGAVIPPWNFPAAIMAGMTLASIVCGNTVVLKPSSDSPTIAAKFVELLEEADLLRVGQFRLSQLDQHAVGILGMDEGLPPGGIVEADVDRLPARRLQLLEPPAQVFHPEGEVMDSLAPPIQEAGHESVVVGGLHQLDDPAARELELRPAETPGRLLGAHQEARAQDVADQGDHARHLPGGNGHVVEAVRDRHPPHYAPGPPAHASGARRAMRAFEASSPVSTRFDR